MKRNLNLLVEVGRIGAHVRLQVRNACGKDAVIAFALKYDSDANKYLFIEKPQNVISLISLFLKENEIEDANRKFTDAIYNAIIDAKRLLVKEVGGDAIISLNFAAQFKDADFKLFANIINNHGTIRFFRNEEEHHYYLNVERKNWESRKHPLGPFRHQEYTYKRKIFTIANDWGVNNNQLENMINEFLNLLIKNMEGSSDIRACCKFDSSALETGEIMELENPPQE